MRVVSDDDGLQLTGYQFLSLVTASFNLSISSVN